MCYAIPGKIKSISDTVILVDYFGEEKKAYNDFYDLAVGDYVFAQGGYVVQKVSKKEAEEILSVWKETFFELQEVDLRLSSLDLKSAGIERKTALILDKIAQNSSLSKEEALYLINSENEREIELMLKTANFLRQKYLKNSCCVHGIIEISNRCQNMCSYCGISANNKTLSRYTMTKEEIFEAAKEAVNRHGFKALMLQSGENHGCSVDDLGYVIERIKNELGALVFISFGEIGLKNLEKLYKKGARGLLMRFETSNPEIYRNICSGNELEDRLEHIKNAYEIGYLIATGSLIGIPGQTKEDIINDIYLARDLKAEMFSFGPFLAHPETPLFDIRPVMEKEMLKTLALARFIGGKEVKILITTAFETLSKDARKKGLLSGANSVMINVTPRQYRKLYTLYPKRAHDQEDIVNQINDTVSLLRSIGRAPTDLGAS